MDASPSLGYPSALNWPVVERGTVGVLTANTSNESLARAQIKLEPLNWESTTYTNHLGH